MLQKLKKNPSAFLRNTYNILMKGEFTEIISWTPDGTSFSIKNLGLFETAILPRYFKHHKFSSFVRQLNMYGFHKVRFSEYEHTFLHQKFRRDDDRLCQIKRKPQKKKKLKTTAAGLVDGDDPSSQISNRAGLPQLEHAYDGSISESSGIVELEANELAQTSNSFDQQCTKLYETLMIQNKTMVGRQNQLRNVLLMLKRSCINLLQHQKALFQVMLQTDENSTVQTIENSLLVLHEHTSILDQLQKDQTHVLLQISNNLNSMTKQLISTNLTSFSTTSIQEGFCGSKGEQNHRI